MSSLLRALLAAIEGQPQPEIADVDPTLLLDTARRHRLTPLLSMVGLPGIDLPLAETLRRDRLITTGRNLLLEQTAEECTIALAASSWAAGPGRLAYDLVRTAGS